MLLCFMKMTYCMSQTLLPYQCERETLSEALQWPHHGIYTNVSKETKNHVRKRVNNPHLLKA